MKIEVPFYLVVHLVFPHGGVPIPSHQDRAKDATLLVCHLSDTDILLPTLIMFIKWQTYNICTVLSPEETCIKMKNGSRRLRGENFITIMFYLIYCDTSSWELPQHHLLVSIYSTPALFISHILQVRSLHTAQFS